MPIDGTGTKSTPYFGKSKAAPERLSPSILALTTREAIAPNGLHEQAALLHPMRRAIVKPNLKHTHEMSTSVRFHSWVALAEQGAPTTYHGPAEHGDRWGKALGNQGGDSRNVGLLGVEQQSQQGPTVRPAHA